MVRNSVDIEKQTPPSPQLAASLNSTHKTPVSTSTVKRQLWDASLLRRVAKKKPYLRLANKKKILRYAKEHRHWTEELCLEGQHPSRLFTVDFETGVLQVLFNEAAS